jgi:hypothetical protein
MKPQLFDQLFVHKRQNANLCKIIQVSFQIYHTRPGWVRLT